MRLLIVSNRLPVSVEEKKGKLEFKESSGGLVTGLKAYLDSLNHSGSAMEHVWVGWPGAQVSGENKDSLREKLSSGLKCHPVFISQEDADLFYFGFCNKTIWPLFHYFPAYTLYDSSYWENYNRINRIFCDALLEIIRPGDVVWIHDYHLLLLPGMLREKIPGLSIGFFLHIPFPSYEIFHLLPRKWQSELVNGLLGADLIGFHTHDYTQHFLRCVLRITGYEHTMGQIMLRDRIIKVDTFPMGIDYKKYAEGILLPGAREEEKKLKEAFKDFKVILSMDRLDYTKGIINRLKGYEKFLESNPLWHGKVVFFLLVVPSRTGVEQYQQIRRMIDEKAGNINGKYGTPGWSPIIYQYRSLPFPALIALYSLSDVALVTPLRDGMNLVSKEYVAARRDGSGVLVLSEMAGSSQELGEALIINPNNVDEIADSIKEALEMPLAEQKRRNAVMRKRLERYDLFKWAGEFLSELSQIKGEQKNFAARVLPQGVREELIGGYSKSKNRLILLDYDGTLIPFQDEPSSAKPSQELIDLLNGLCGDQKNNVFLVSGRDKDTLQEWFGSLPIGFIAEHGMWVKEKKSNWKTARKVSTAWKSKIKPLLEMYADRLPGAFIEEKIYSLVFHHRKADSELSSLRVKELRDTLIILTANLDVQVLKGSKVVEFKNAGINKGTAVSPLLKGKYDFILAIGDDWTDEDMFKVLPKTAYTIKVGLNPSYSRFNLYGAKDVLRLLGELVNRR